MTPRQARRILREMPRADRRDTFRGIYKYSVDGLNWYAIDRHGIPVLLDHRAIVASIGAKMDADFLKLAAGGVPADIGDAYADVRRAMGVPSRLLGYGALPPIMSIVNVDAS